MDLRDAHAFVADEGLGVDPLVDGMDPDTFRDLVGGRRGSVKGLLMNQRVIAGLGNVYTDEILFHAGIHPSSAVGALGDDDLSRLHEALFRVVEGAIDAGTDPSEMPDGWLLPHREEGEPCPRCDGEIDRIDVVSRSTYLCTRHQRRVG